jgi:hypothetical protein
MHISKADIDGKPSLGIDNPVQTVAKAFSHLDMNDAATLF